MGVLASVAELLKNRLVLGIAMKEYGYLPLSLVKEYEPLAASKGVSQVARSPRGFLTAYKRAGGKPNRLSEAWRKKRHAFIARHLAQLKGEDKFKNGEPTRRHLALIMWAYSPRAQNI